MNEQRWLELVSAVLDDEGVPWDGIRAGLTDQDRSTVDDLHLVAEVAAAHRTANLGGVTRWGPLDLLEKIGDGTFGEVYRARDSALEREVALKLLRGPATLLALDEGRLLARVRHPNVVTVHGAAIHDGRYGIWMEFVRGRTLADIVREDGPREVSETLQTGRELCRALTAVHSCGLVHGDLKAQNAMREDTGRVVLMDFGSGRLTVDAASAGKLAGTPLYLAPEVLRGDEPDSRSDVYGLGVLLYFLLTAAFPVEGRTLGDVRAAHAAGVRTPIADRRPDVPVRLASIIERATSPDRAARFATAGALEQALTAADPKRHRAVRTRRTWAAAVFVVALAGVSWWRLAQPKSPPLAFLPRDTVLIASFDNRTGDARFDRSLESALGHELSRSAYVNVIPRPKISQALQLMGRDPDDVVNASLGPEVARRDGTVRVVLEGTIERRGTDYAITLRVVDPHTEVTLESDRENASSPDVIPAAIRRLSEWIRTSLGEPAPNVSRDPGISPPLAVMPLYADALNSFDRSHFDDAVSQFASVVTQAPQFAAAHTWLAWTYVSLHEPREKALASARRAVDLVGTASERERYWILGSYYLLMGDDDASLGPFETLAARYPDDKWGVRQLNTLYGRAGQTERVMNKLVRMAAASPDNFSAQTLAAERVLNIRGLDAARPYIDRAGKVAPEPLTSRDVDIIRQKAWLLLSSAHDLWIQRRVSDATAVLSAVSSKPELDEGLFTLSMLGRLHLALGQVRAAEKVFDRITDGSLRAIHLAEVALARGDRRAMLVSLASFQSGDPRGISLLIRAGDLSAARRYLESHAREANPADLQWAKDELAEASGDSVQIAKAMRAGEPWIPGMIGDRRFMYSETLARAAMAEGDSAGAIRLLEDLSGLAPRIFPFFTASQWYWTRTQKLLADLYRETGQIDKAREIERDLEAALAAADEDYPLLVDLKKSDR